ncbi:30S ribosomal protein S21 [Candidatus Pacearchaeota archaeon]|jgi:small subunit ribosomal protein S21|nr:30S ribosomal protein S21 [Candidatus Pacearchaeota archaeon]|tara:strand:- start:2603 stop:2818 length:216 start_codon:yes stop_codon:yes gene_type:complete
MIKVVVRDNKIELALKQFKRKVKDSGLLLELREREFYKKPSDIKRVKKSKAKLRIKYDKLRRQREKMLRGF